MRYILIVTLFVFLASCKDPNKKPATLASESKNVVEQTSASKNSKQEEARRWLIQNIEQYFAPEQESHLDFMKKITTSEYFDYKMDAMNVDMGADGSMSEKAFHEKWKSRFDTQKAGIQSGFLISGQDWDKIKVTQCKLRSDSAGYLFDVLLDDKGFNSKYAIDVLVKADNGNFLIADVREK